MGGVPNKSRAGVKIFLETNKGGGVQINLGGVKISLNTARFCQNGTFEISDQKYGGR